jgi:squalene-hopene/tetraprenyl-beta-curcumene cyclase
LGRFRVPLTLSSAAGVGLAVLLAGSPAGPSLATTSAAAPAEPAWDRRAAERYLDAREVWWQSWDRPHKDRGTLCVSCHTQATYGLARPLLRQDLGEPGPSGAEQAMLASIEKRVRQFSLMQPFYSDVVSGAGKEVESRNAEAVLNAFILTGYDARQGRLRDITRTAFDNAWALQSKTGPDAGAWVWQNFGLAPWESKESQYHWAALMAVTVAKAPDHYRDDPKIAANLAALTAYLRDHYAGQPLLNKVVLLWASASFPDLLGAPERASLIAELGRLQHPDGGWSLPDLGPWTRVDTSAPHTGSDGYATAVTVLVLEEIGARGDPHVGRGLAWLVANQDKATGAWRSWSVNKDRDPGSDAGPFMTDAATAYAVMALEAGR